MGDEGGCDCRTSTIGIFNPRSFCSSCLPGYGPNTYNDYVDIELFKLRLNGSNEKFLDFHPERCTIPINFESTRVTSLCGGKARVVRKTLETRNKTLKVRETHRGTLRTIQCDYIKYNGNYYNITKDPILSLDIVHYSGENAQSLNLIFGRLYNQTEEITTPFSCERENKEYKEVLWDANKNYTRISSIIFIH